MSEERDRKPERGGSPQRSSQQSSPAQMETKILLPEIDSLTPSEKQALKKYSQSILRDPESSDSDKQKAVELIKILGVNSGLLTP